MTTPNGYNNPAYSHQFDSSLYDYQYVPEIDPDSPDVEEESNRKSHKTKLKHPGLLVYPRESSNSSEGSDESNGSIIIEECKNRRVTLICEKRNKSPEFYRDENLRGGYYQDISLESEKGHEKDLCDRRKNDGRSLRHQKALEPPVEQIRTFTSSGNNNISRNPSFKQSIASINNYERPQKIHRYEEIMYEEEPTPVSSVHRYAEITTDHNGYPSLSKEIKIEQDHRYEYPQKPKPRAISPITFPLPQTTRNVQSKPLKEFDLNISRFSPSSSPIIYSSSPLKTNSFEMFELSPPRLADGQRHNEHTFFISNPKRQPPIGASAGDTQTERCILPKNLQQTKRCKSLPNSPRRRKDFSYTNSPLKPQSNKKVIQIFHIKKNQPKYKTNDSCEIEKTPVRRNISNYFNDLPNEYNGQRKPTGSPYKSTTAEISTAKTAVITPIFQRKNQAENLGIHSRNFEMTSKVFQSTGNLFRSTRETARDPKPTQQNFISPVKIKRNQSVPNFSQTLAAENKLGKRAQWMDHNEKYSKNLDLQYSPKKPSDHVSSMEKSRISLINQTNSWSNLESVYQPRCSVCFIFATFVHLLTASATCAICFYLLSRVGRKYYLDFGLLAGFTNFILGLLGFRSYCWRWLPNRNYVSGFIALAAFSALTCAGLTYLIVARPMAGDPLLDIMGGAICAVSVLTILLSLTGLTMSGCCKTPPPDNRVTDI